MANITQNLKFEKNLFIANICYYYLVDDFFIDNCNGFYNRFILLGPMIQLLHKISIIAIAEKILRLYNWWLIILLKIKTKVKTR